MKFKANENIDRIFLAKKAEVKTTKNGKQYLDLNLVDKKMTSAARCGTGTIQSPRLSL